MNNSETEEEDIKFLITLGFSKEEALELSKQKNTTEYTEEKKEELLKEYLEERQIRFAKKRKTLPFRLHLLGFVLLGLGLISCTVIGFFSYQSVWVYLIACILVPIGVSFIAIEVKLYYQLIWWGMWVFIGVTYMPDILKDIKHGTSTIISEDFYADICKPRNSDKTYKCFIIPEANLSIRIQKWHKTDNLKAIEVTYYPNTQTIKHFTFITE